MTVGRGVLLAGGGAAALVVAALVSTRVGAAGTAPPQPSPTATITVTAPATATAPPRPLVSAVFDKELLYEQKVRFMVPAHGALIASAACRDARDFPVQGACISAGKDLVLTSTAARSWDRADVPSAHECRFTNAAGIEEAFYAQIVCYDHAKLAARAAQVTTR